MPRVWATPSTREARVGGGQRRADVEVRGERPADDTETACAVPVSLEVSRSLPSTTDAATSPPAALILPAMAEIVSPACTATSNCVPAPTCSTSSALAAASDDRCVRTSARASDWISMA